MPRNYLFYQRNATYSKGSSILTFSAQTKTEQSGTIWGLSWFNYEIITETIL